MEKIGTRQICATFMGCFLGAGFVSGQELWQYFGCFGIQGILGLFTACLILTGLGLILLLTAGMSGTGEMDRVVIPSDIPWLRGVTGAVQISFMFGIYTVMASGAGTLIESQTGSHLARILGSAVFCAIVTVISLGGVEAVVKTFGRVVPVLVTLTIVTALIVIGKNGIARIEVTADAASNPLLGNWGIAAANFTSYNFFCAIGALAPLGLANSSRKPAVKGVLSGGLFLFIIGLCLVLAMHFGKAAADTQLPILTLAGMVHPLLAWICALFLLCAMLGAAMSVFTPVPRYFSRFERIRKHKTLFSAVLGLAAWAGSQLGFGSLISVLYPVYGYIAFAVIAMLLIHFVKNISRRNMNGDGRKE